MPGRGPDDRTWTHGERDSTRLQRKRGKPPVKLNDPTPEELREAVEEQRCWWCGREGFVSLATHCSRKHGISAMRLRELAGLFRHSRLCSPMYASYCAQRPQSSVGVYPTNVLKGDLHAQRHLSEAGRRSVIARLERIHANPDSEKQRIEAARIGALKNAKPHHCPVCGKLMPFSFPITCSPECRRVIRQKTALKGMAHISREPLRRPHNCPTCGNFIPTARPKYCSRTCERIAKSQKKACHPCTVCGKDTGTHRKRTCSKQCLQKARRKQGLNYQENLRNTKSRGPGA